MPDEDRQAIAALREQADEEDRVYKMHLAAVREAGHLTQADIARRLGKPQGNVSRTERSEDMLFSTLRSYLEAAGARDVAITATVAGRRVEIALDTASH
ncbi:MAG: helix-turn-helix domain-containing protein [Micrococcales bacterium]|nr:helix-turn-helix domain-containing protein [Micrococcales bacterium]